MKPKETVVCMKLSEPIHKKFKLYCKEKNLIMHGVMETLLLDFMKKKKKETENEMAALY